MKKLLLLIFSLLFVCNVYAVSEDDTKIDLSKYETSNFKEILEEEQIELKNANYKENDKQAVIYVFRGNGCQYCKGFLNFINSLSEEYGEMFRVVGFEVWNNEDNWKLMETISSFKGEKAGGVPYIVIGEYAFPGYTSNYDESIIAAISHTYKSENEYDVFEEYNKAVSDAQWKAIKGTLTVIIWNFIFLAAATFIIIKKLDNNKKEILNAINKNNKEVNSNDKKKK